MNATVKISHLKSNKKNPRYISSTSFDTLCRLIEKYPKFLEKRPIVIDSWDNPVILAGNMRFKALRKLKYKEIPAAWVTTAEGLSDDEKEAFMIVDNNPLGQWDFEMLANEFDISMLDDLNLFIPNLNMPGDDEDVQAIETQKPTTTSVTIPNDNVTVKLSFTIEDFKTFNERIYEHGETMEAAILNLLNN